MDFNRLEMSQGPLVRLKTISTIITIVISPTILSLALHVMEFLGDRIEIVPGFTVNPTSAD